MTVPALQPVFILSMPRSGSTLLQRLVGNADYVATHAEPWIMLPLMEHMLADDSPSASRYDGATAAVAVAEFTDRLPHGRADVEAAIRTMVTSLYDSASEPGTRFYLDKTPRYAAYLDELMAVFPSARYIVLQRDIREVIASIIRTWGAGKWNVFLYTIDLVDGFDRLSALSQNPGPNCLVIEFADLVDDLPATSERISKFLGIHVPPALLPPDDPAIEGSVGDRESPGRRAEGTVRPHVHWDENFQGVVRRLWLAWYLRRRRRAGSVVPGPIPITTARRLYDHPSDLLLVPMSLLWPTLNQLSGFRLETAVRSRRSSIVRQHLVARPQRRIGADRVRGGQSAAVQRPVYGTTSER